MPCIFLLLSSIVQINASVEERDREFSTATEGFLSRPRVMESQRMVAFLPRNRHRFGGSPYTVITPHLSLRRSLASPPSKPPSKLGYGTARAPPAERTPRALECGTHVLAATARQLRTDFNGDLGHGDQFERFRMSFSFDQRSTIRQG